MNSVTFRFYEELNDFLSSEKKKIPFEYFFEGTPSVKDIIESFGVPHTEVDLILVNGISVNFEYKLNNGDYVSVYPVFENFDIRDVTHLRPEPLREPRFICDVQLGKLARYMRFFGFDTLYDNNFSENKIIEISNNLKRTILTKNIHLLKNKTVTHGYWIRSQNTEQQIVQIIIYSDLLSHIKPFSLCPLCNGKLEPVDKENISDKVLAETKLYFNEFSICQKCRKIYWKGSHYNKIMILIGNIIQEVKLFYDNKK